MKIEINIDSLDYGSTEYKIFLAKLELLCVEYELSTKWVED